MAACSRVMGRRRPIEQQGTPTVACAEELRIGLPEIDGDGPHRRRGRGVASGRRTRERLVSCTRSRLRKGRHWL